MFKKLFSLFAVSLLSISSFVSGAIEYEIQDIGTLQTHSSEAIAINNQGEILGWYNIDGSKEGKHFFLRDKEGFFHEIPIRENGIGHEINWKFLTKNGSAYGTFDGNANFSVLYIWTQENGVSKLGNLPGKTVVTVNDLGQVLIKSVQENENGKTIVRPVIWHNGKITKLHGLEGDLGVESEESYGYDMNNKGEVVGQSLTSLVYKNNVYYQIHAVKWIKGKVIDLQNTVPKTDKTVAIAVNDRGDLMIHSINNGLMHVVENKGNIRRIPGYHKKMNNIGHTYFEGEIKDENNDIGGPPFLNKEIQEDRDSIWHKVNKFIVVNDKGEIIAEGETIYGEKHAMLLTPVEKN